jgi:iron complex transport system ATP-binding protein
LQETPGDEMPAEGALTLDNLTFAYADRMVFRDVSLRIAAGEMVGLLGPNGAGKTTLLKVISGVRRPASGVVLVGGQDLWAFSRTEIARRIAVVPQDFAVPFAYTVRQLVEMGRMPHTGSWGILRMQDRAAVAEALHAARLSELADRPFSELSGGERQRVVIAMALAQSTGVVLLDEPTAHLDIRHQVETLELLRALNQERGLTVLAALHDLNLAARYFLRLVLFRGGIVADGPPTAVLDARLLGEVYGIAVQVGILRGEEFLSVLPPGGRPSGSEAGATPQVAVHVVAGGGAGELAMRALSDAGLAFTAGALNAGDSDHTLAMRLAARCISEAPYAPLSAESVTATRACMLAAPVVLLCPTALGPGNVALVEAALDTKRAGRRVLLLELDLSQGEMAAVRGAVLDRVRGRDFTGGRALELYRALLDLGAEVVGSPSAAAQAVQRVAAATARA